MLKYSIYEKQILSYDVWRLNMTLYRINTKNYTISFVWSIKKSALLSAKEKETVYTFDEILSQLEDFREHRLIIFEIIKNEMMKGLNERIQAKDLTETLKKSVCENSNNIFFKYYSNELTAIYAKIGEPIFLPKDYISEKFHHKKLVETARQQLQDSFNDILNIINDERNFDYKATGDILVAMPTSQLAVIRTKNENIIYRVADSLLITFFYEFSNAVFEAGFKICECRFCHKHFLGTEIEVCCKSNKCINEQKKLKNKQTREKRKNNLYAHEVDNYHTYVRNIKKELVIAKISPFTMDEFKDLQAEKKKVVNAKLKECEEFGLPLNELITVTDECKAKIKEFKVAMIKK